MTTIIIISSDPPAPPDARIDVALGMLNTIQERLASMSSTETQFETDLAAQTAGISSLQSAATAQLAAIQALKDQLANGGQISAADLASLEANTLAIANVTSGMTPPTPAPT